MTPLPTQQNTTKCLRCWKKSLSAVPQSHIFLRHPIQIPSSWSRQPARFFYLVLSFAFNVSTSTKLNSSFVNFRHLIVSQSFFTFCFREFCRCLLQILLFCMVFWWLSWMEVNWDFFVGEVGNLIELLWGVWRELTVGKVIGWSSWSAADFEDLCGFGSIILWLLLLVIF
jgi:hypothetical protein